MSEARFPQGSHSSVGVEHALQHGVSGHPSGLSWKSNSHVISTNYACSSMLPTSMLGHAIEANPRHVKPLKSPTDSFASDQEKPYNPKDDQCHHSAKGGGRPTNGDSVLPGRSPINAWCPRIEKVDLNHSDVLLFQKVSVLHSKVHSSISTIFSLVSFSAKGYAEND
jgi:hypothetical protein